MTKTYDQIQAESEAMLRQVGCPKLPEGVNVPGWFRVGDCFDGFAEKVVYGPEHAAMGMVMHGSYDRQKAEEMCVELNALLLWAYAKGHEDGRAFGLGPHRELIEQELRHAHAREDETSGRSRRLWAAIEAVKGAKK